MVILSSVQIQQRLSAYPRGLFIHCEYKHAWCLMYTAPKHSLVEVGKIFLYFFSIYPVHAHCVNNLSYSNI